MGDSIDRAQQYDEIYRESAITEHMAIRRIDALQAPALYCLDCGDKIDEARRRAVNSATRCVDCQSSFERRSRRSS